MILDEKIHDIALFIKEEAHKVGLESLSFTDCEYLGKLGERLGLETVKVFIAGSKIPAGEKSFVFSILIKIQEAEIKDSFVVGVIIQGINGILKYY